MKQFYKSGIIHPYESTARTCRQSAQAGAVWALSVLLVLKEVYRENAAHEVLRRLPDRFLPRSLLRSQLLLRELRIYDALGEVNYLAVALGSFDFFRVDCCHICDLLDHEEVQVVNHDLPL